MKIISLNYIFVPENKGKTTDLLHYQFIKLNEEKI